MTADTERIAGLLERLKAAKFAGELRIRFYDGISHSIELHHLIGVEQLEKPIVAAEKEEELTLKP